MDLTDCVRARNISTRIVSFIFIFIIRNALKYVSMNRLSHFECMICLYILTEWFRIRIRLIPSSGLPSPIFITQNDAIENDRKVKKKKKNLEQHL